MSQASRRHMGHGECRRPLLCSIGWLSALAIGLTTGACSSIDYRKLSPGQLSGSLFVMWVGEGDNSGDGKFLYVPDPEDPLVFRRPDPDARGGTIRPGIMYTDGGSIPKIAQAFKGLSPWGYAPAYMVHDWIFTAHHCIVDGSAESRFDQVRGVEFDDSAAILGEAIKTLVDTRRVASKDIAPDLITAAVASPVARKLWDEHGACRSLQVSAKDIAAAEAAIPGSTTKAQNLRTFRLPKAVEPSVPATKPARIVARVSL